MGKRYLSAGPIGGQARDCWLWSEILLDGQKIA